MKSLQIFKPGRHLANNGDALQFSEGDLEAAAKAYDPAKHEAPIVVGHPKNNDPAYGWVRSLNYSEGALNAEPHQVDAAFAELVAAGRYKKISAAFYTPEAPANPVPGVYYLRHVGFLGAQPPAVKGLRDAHFAEGEQGVIEFGDWMAGENAGLWRRLREWIISKFTIEDADQVIPDYLIKSLEDAARAAETSSAAASYSEPTEEGQRMNAEQAAREAALKKQHDDLKAGQEALAVQQADFAEREKQIKALEAAQRRAGLAGIVDKLVAQGKVLPAFKDGLVAFMGTVDDAGTVEFGEGEKKVTKPAITWLTEYLAGQPKIVEFKEIANTGETVDLDDPNKIAAKALEYQESEKKAGRVISITEAVQHITGGK